MLFGSLEVLAVVVKGSEIDVRGRMCRLEIQDLVVSRYRFVMSAGMFFERNASNEQVRRRFARLDRVDFGRDYRANRIELHQELAAYRLHGMALMTEGETTAKAEDAGLDQRVLHTGNLLLHRLKRLADDGWTHALSPKVADFHQL